MVVYEERGGVGVARLAQRIINLKTKGQIIILKKNV